MLLRGGHPHGPSWCLRIATPVRGKHPSMGKKAQGSRPAEEPPGPHHRPPWQSQEAQQLLLRQRQPESCYAAAAAALHRPASQVMGPWLRALMPVDRYISSNP